MLNNLLYPIEFEPIDVIQLRDELLEIKRNTVLSTLKELNSIRNLGSLEINNQLTLIEAGYGTVKGINKNDHQGVSALYKEDTFVYPTVISSVAFYQSYINKQKSLKKKERDTAFNDGLDRLPMQILTPMPTSLNNIPSLPVIDEVKGKGGHFFGGWTVLNDQVQVGESIEKYDFASEFLYPLSKKMGERKSLFALTGQNNSFWTFGGWRGNFGQVSDNIERFIYFDNRSYLSQTRLSQTKFLSTGLSTNSASYIFGGIEGMAWRNRSNNRLAYPTNSSIEKFNHLSEIRTPLSLILQTSIASTPNSKGNKNYGYLFSTISNSWTGNNNIQRFNFPDESLLSLSILLMGHQFGSSNIGTESNIYLLGGRNTNIWTEAIDVVTKFSLSSETIIASGLSLAEARTFSASINSSRSGIVSGGWNSSNNQEIPFPTKTLQQITPLDNSEIITMVGLELTQSMSEHGGISDYGVTFNSN